MHIDTDVWPFSVSKINNQATREELRDWIMRVVVGGYLDDDLADLARAVFARRDVLNGTNSFIDKMPDDPRLRAQTVIPTQDVPLAVDSVKRTNPLYYRGVSFTYKGSYYLKAQIVGKRVTIPGDYHDTEVAGHVVRVDAIARSRCDVVFDPAVRLHTPRYSLRKAAYTGKPVTMSIDILREVLSS